MERQGEKRRRSPGKGEKNRAPKTGPSPSPAGVEWKPGASVAGFRVESVTPLHEQDETAFLLVHERTGMQWLHFRADDPVSSCAIAVATPVSDDRGLPHVLEHLVYEGSKRFPATDLMREMADRTAAEEMNGTTCPFMTYYHFSSAVDSDMRALFQVWFDAILAPELSDEAFLREAGRFRPADPNHPEGPLSFTGVVFNEMRNRTSDLFREFLRKAERALLPETHFGYVSGGIPADIMTLTPDDVRAYHGKWYRPANMRVVTRGSDMPSDLLAEADRRLEGVDPGEAAPPFRPQPRWDRPRETEIDLGVPPHRPHRAPPPPELAQIWLVPGPGWDEERKIAWSLFRSVFDFKRVFGLVDGDGDPDSTAFGRFREFKDCCGPDACWGFFGTPDEGSVTFDAGMETDAWACDSLERLLNDPGTANRIRQAAERQTRELVQSVNDGEGTGELARGEGFSSILEDWILCGDPFRMLRSSDRLGLYFRFQRDPEAVIGIVRDLLLDHPHRLDVSMRHVVVEGTLDDEAMDARLRERRKELSDDECRALTLRDEELAAKTRRETAADLPETRLDDIPAAKVSFRYGFEQDAICESGFLDVLERAKGEAWMVAFADLRDFSSERLLFLPHVLSAAKRATASRGAELEVEPMSYSNVLTGSRVHGVLLRAPLLFDRIDETIGALSALFKVRDPLPFPRAHSMVRRWAKRKKALNEWRQSYMRSKVWATGASADESLLAACNDDGALNHLVGFRTATTRPDKDESPDFACARLAAEFVRSASETADLFHNPARWTFSLVGPRHVVRPFRQKILSVLRSAPCAPIGPAAEQKFAPRTDAEESRYAIPDNDQRNSEIRVSIPAPADSVLDRRLFEIGAGLVERDIAFRRIRREIGAYHVQFEWSDNAFFLGSMDNPDIAETLGSLDRLEKDIAAAEWTQEDVRLAALRVARRYLTRPAPQELATRTLFRHLSGATPERIMDELKEISTFEPGAIKRALMRAIRSGLRIASIHVEANEKAIAEANQHLPPDRRIRLPGEDGALGGFD